VIAGSTLPDEGDGDAGASLVLLGLALAAALRRSQ
jgi:MYXO-CTERM domain-containing protein